jgi:hypothetical protein
VTEPSRWAQSGLSFDLGTASGKLMRTSMAGLAEFERDLIRERVNSGIQAAKQFSGFRSLFIGAEKLLILTCSQAARDGLARMDSRRARRPNERIVVLLLGRLGRSNRDRAD